MFKNCSVFKFKIHIPFRQLRASPNSVIDTVFKRTVIALLLDQAMNFPYMCKITTIPMKMREHANTVVGPLVKMSISIERGGYLHLESGSIIGVESKYALRVLVRGALSSSSSSHDGTLDWTDGAGG